MKVLVTGSTGFIGRHLVKRLLRQHHEVFCLVRKTSNRQVVKSLRDIGAQTVLGDLRKIDAITLPKNIDWIFHLAALVDTTHKYQLSTLRRENVETTRKLAEKYLGKIEKFIYLSSMSVYGDLGKNQKVTEETSCNPHFGYGRSKLETEGTLLDLYKKYKFPVVIIRPPTVYGEGEHYNFLKLAKGINKGKFFLIGGGGHTMELCYVENLVDLLLKAAKSNKAIGEIFIVNNGKTYLFKDIAKEIAKAEKKNIPTFEIPYPLAYFAGLFFEGLAKVVSLEPPLTRATVKTLSSSVRFDISKAKKILGYNPQINFSRSIQETIDSFQKEGKLN